MAKRGSAAPAPAPSSSSGVQRAHELFKQGRAKEALALLRPLLQRKGDVDANVCALAAARLDEDPDLLPFKDDPELLGRLPGGKVGEDPYQEYYATRS